MRVLVDTNVCLDYILGREPFCRTAGMLFLASANEMITGCITSKQTSDIYYLAHRITHDREDSRNILSTVFDIFEILDSTAFECKKALASGRPDYEDAMMAETALTNEIDAIVTRDQEGFAGIRTPVYSPEEFIEQHLGDRIKELDEMMDEAMSGSSGFTV